MQNLPVLLKMREAKDFAAALSSFIATHLPCSSIENIHNHLSSSLLTEGTDQSTPIHRLVYDEFDRGFDSLLYKKYRRLCKAHLDYLRKHYSIDDWAIQRFPSLRVQLPGNVSVFEFHRDSDYSHPLGEINHFLAITRCTGSAALWYERHLGWEDYHALSLDSNQSALLNTSIFKHGDLLNKESFTRVSIDFRSIPLHVLRREPQKQSLTKGLSLDEHSYFIDSKILSDDC